MLCQWRPATGVVEPDAGRAGVRLGVLIGLGLPLYLVTMASPNRPGGAVLRPAGQPVPVASCLAVTASCVTLLGIGAAFWGLMAGLIALGLDRAAARVRA